MLKESTDVPSVLVPVLYLGKGVTHVIAIYFNALSRTDRQHTRSRERGRIVEYVSQLSRFRPELLKDRRKTRETEF